MYSYYQSKNKLKCQRCTMYVARLTISQSKVMNCEYDHDWIIKFCSFVSFGCFFYIQINYLFTQNITQWCSLYFVWLVLLFGGGWWKGGGGRGGRYAVHISCYCPIKEKSALRHTITVNYSSNNYYYGHLVLEHLARTGPKHLHIL